MKTDKALCPLYNYLNTSDPENKEYYDLLRYVLDQRIYYYGSNFSHPYERYVSSLEMIKRKIFRKAYYYYVIFNSLFEKKKNKNIKIWSTAYFNLEDKINIDKYSVSSPPWIFSLKESSFNDCLFFKKLIKIKDKIDFSNVNELLNTCFYNDIEIFKTSIKEFVLKEDVKAVFLANDLGFFDKLIISVFKEIKRPTFLMIHGLPGVYGKIDNNRTDYLVVWGKSIKANYVEQGVDPNKIIVNGHPKYDVAIKIDLKHKFDDILVLPKSMNGAPMGDEYTLRDRGNCIYYMLMVQNVLRKLGVTFVRFRPHPSESIEWYLKQLDNSFFMPDYDTLDISLKKSTLVIGPTSTVFLESLIYGVNYIVFEPRLENGNCLSNFPVIAPFNGEDTKVPSAKTEKELYYNLSNNVTVDTSILKDYVETSFNPNLILDKIE